MVSISKSRFGKGTVKLAATSLAPGQKVAPMGGAGAVANAAVHDPAGGFTADRMTCIPYFYSSSLCYGRLYMKDDTTVMAPIPGFKGILGL
jgi:hypothetical protein